MYTFQYWTQLPASIQLYIAQHNDINTIINLVQCNKAIYKLLSLYLPHTICCQSCNTILCDRNAIEYNIQYNNNQQHSTAIYIKSLTNSTINHLQCSHCKLYLGNKVDINTIKLNYCLLKQSYLTTIKNKLFHSSNTKLNKQIPVLSPNTTVYTIDRQYITIHNCITQPIRYSCNNNRTPITCKYCDHCITNNKPLTDHTKFLQYISKQNGILINSVDPCNIIESTTSVSYNIVNVLQYSSNDIFCIQCKHYIGIRITNDTCDQLISFQSRYILHTNCINYNMNTNETSVTERIRYNSMSHSIVAEPSRSSFIATYDSMDIEYSDNNHTNHHHHNILYNKQFDSIANSDDNEIQLTNQQLYRYLNTPDIEYI